MCPTLLSKPCSFLSFVLVHSGDEPMMGKHFDWEGHRFEIVDMDGRRIDRILVVQLAKEDAR